MVDPMRERLDAIDRQLLSLLQANAREPAAILARKLGLARTTIVARLERESIVAGYGVRLGHLLEEAAVRAYCFIYVQPKPPAAVIRELEKMPEVEEVSSVSGPYDYLIFLRCETHEQLDALLDRIGLIDGVKQTQTSIVLNRKVDHRSAVGAP